MIRTVEAIIDEKGTVLLQEAVALTGPHRALVTILEEEPHSNGVQPVRPPRQGWEEQYQQMAELGEDQLLDADALALTPTQWETEEWEW